MLAWLANSERRTHSVLYGIERPTNWIAPVLGPWRGDDGRPTVSPGETNLRCDRKLGLRVRNAIECSRRPIRGVDRPATSVEKLRA